MCFLVAEIKHMEMCWMNAKLDVSLADSFQDPEARVRSYLHAY